MSLKKITVAAAAAGLLATGSATVLAGTAWAATPGPATTTAAAPDVTGFPLFDPHGRRFRAHFRTYGQCVFFANHDRDPRTHGWDCRRGGDRNFPWEYWY